MKTDPHHRRSLGVPGVALIAALLLAACGPATFTRTRTEFGPVSPTENRQEKDGVVAEIKFEKQGQLPPSFLATVQACNRAGQLLVDRTTGRPIAEQISLVQPDQYWEQLALTNNTDHVLRLSGVAIRLFDPSGGQYEPMNWGDLQAELMRARPCPSTRDAIGQFRVNKVFDRNMEIVPGSTSTFWVPFRPASMSMPGVWRFTIYEVPVRVDEAGRASRTTQFDIRVVSKQFVDTYTRTNPLEPAKLIESREVSDAATPRGPAATARAPAPPPARPAAEQTSAPPREARTPAQAAGSSAYKPTSARATDSQVSRDVIAGAQARLNALGFDVGAADGIMGPRSQKAIARFQTSKGLPADGELTAETLRALGVGASQPAAPAESVAPAQPAPPEKPVPTPQPVKAKDL